MIFFVHNATVSASCLPVLCIFVH